MPVKKEREDTTYSVGGGGLRLCRNGRTVHVNASQDDQMIYHEKILATVNDEGQ